MITRTLSSFLLLLVTLLTLISYSYGKDSTDIVNSCRESILTKDYKNAHKIGMSALEKNPYDYSGHYCLGLMYLMSGDYNRAELFLSTAKQLVSSNKSVLPNIKRIVNMNYLVAAIGQGRMNGSTLTREIDKVAKSVKSYCQNSKGIYVCPELVIDSYLFFSIAASYFESLGNNKKACSYTYDLLALLYDEYNSSETDPQYQSALNTLISEQERVYKQYRCR